MNSDYILRPAVIGLAALALAGLQRADAGPKPDKSAASPKKPQANVNPIPRPHPAHGGGWKPDPALLNKLGPESRIGSYALRLPTGFTVADQGADKTRQEYACADYATKGGSRVVIHIYTFPGPFLSLTSDKLLDTIDMGRRNNRQGLATSKRQHGAANGMALAREYFTYSLGGKADKGRAMHGFDYASISKSGGILIEALDPGPVYASKLSWAETSVLTLHKR